MTFFLRALASLPLLLLAFYLLSINTRLYHQARIIEDEHGQYDLDTYQSLQFLKTSLVGGAGEDMQTLYPEGFLFVHALYGLSWANCIQNLDNEHPIYQEGLAALRWTISRLESKEARSIFSSRLHPSYGIFYQAWLNITRAQYLKRLSGPTKDSLQYSRFQYACQDIAAAIEQHYTPFLYSYPTGSWPADNVVGLAVLAEHGRLGVPRYDSLCQAWLSAMQTRVDSLGLIPHRVDLGRGHAAEAAMGSSQSLMLAFWPLIDSSFARTQYAIFKKHFIDERWGLPGVREYPKGQTGAGHIDAGPILLDIGGAASLVSMGTVAQYGDEALHIGLRNSIEGFGVPFSCCGQKRYLGGQIPMADAFITWSRSRVPLALLQNNQFPKGGFHWRSALALLLILGIGWRLIWK